MVHVLLLREPKNVHDQDPYHTALQAVNWTSESLAVLQHVPVNTKDLEHTLHHRDPSFHAGLILTSQRAVQVWTQAVLSANDPEQIASWTSLPIFVVGHATAQALQAGFPDHPMHIHGQDSGNADRLADAIISYSKEVSSIGPWLYLVGDKNRDTLLAKLSSHDIRLETFQVYETSIRPGFAQELESKLTDNDLDVEWIVFFSPSGVDAALPVIEATTKSFKLATLGPVTRDHVTSRGQQVLASAETPSPQDLVRALVEATTSDPASET